MQTDLFAPEISAERLDELIVESFRRQGFYVAERGAAIGGWSRDCFEEAHVRVGMEMWPVSGFRKVFKTFMEISQ